MLLCGGAMTDGGEHHLPRHKNLDRPAELARRRCCQRGLRPGEELAAESTAAEIADDFHAVEWNAQHLRRDALVIHDTLSGLIKRKVAVLPDGRGGVHLHRIMGFGGGTVEALNLYRS